MKIFLRKPNAAPPREEADPCKRPLGNYILNFRALIEIYVFAKVKRNYIIHFSPVANIWLYTDQVLFVLFVLFAYFLFSFFNFFCKRAKK